MGNSAGSGGPKINVLKESIDVLFTQLEASVPSVTKLNQSLRTGMSAYNTNLVSTVDIDWGSNHLDKAVQGLMAKGGTNSTPALQDIFTKIVNDRSKRTTNLPVREYAIFMTDGVNNQIIWDEETAAICKKMRADGIELYSIAFTAPEKGQLLLLNCASYNAGEQQNDDDGDDDKGNKKDGRDEDKCQNNGAKGKGQALGLCGEEDNGLSREALEKAKSEYYFDAQNSRAFQDAFATIGKEIGQVDIRITN